MRGALSATVSMCLDVGLGPEAQEEAGDGEMTRFGRARVFFLPLSSQAAVALAAPSPLREH